MLAYILRRCGSVYLQEAVIGWFDGQTFGGSVVETQDVRVLARVVLVPETTLEECGVVAVVTMFVHRNAGQSTSYKFVMGLTRIFGCGVVSMYLDLETWRLWNTFRRCLVDIPGDNQVPMVTRTLHCSQPCHFLYVKG